MGRRSPQAHARVEAERARVEHICSLVTADVGLNDAMVDAALAGIRSGSSLSDVLGELIELRDSDAHGMQVAEMARSMGVLTLDALTTLHTVAMGRSLEMYVRPPTAGTAPPPAAAPKTILERAADAIDARRGRAPTGDQGGI